MHVRGLTFRPITWCCTQLWNTSGLQSRAKDGFLTSSPPTWNTTPSNWSLSACRETARQVGHPSIPRESDVFYYETTRHLNLTLTLSVLVCAFVPDVTFVPVSKATARVEVEDVVAALRPNTCLISIMLANNETGVIMVRRRRRPESIYLSI